MSILKEVKEDISNMNKISFESGNISYEKREILKREIVQFWPRQGGGTATKTLAGMTDGLVYRLLTKIFKVF